MIRNFLTTLGQRFGPAGATAKPALSVGDLVHCEPDEVPGLAGLRTGYLDNRRAELSRLEQALRNGDFATLCKAGHNLKGTGAAYGFAELTEIGRALEAAAKDDNATAVEALLDRIESYISILRVSPEH